MAPLIKCDTLSFSYRDTPILTNVSYEVNPGEFIALIGPNGSGKTTMLQLLMGFLKPKSGSLSLDSSARLGYVPQTPHFDKAFPVSALDIVEMGCVDTYTPFIGISAAGRERAVHALERVGMAEFSKQPFGSLSGGQAQKVLIARALVSNPSILILDEPTANVDAQSEKGILDLIHSLKRETTILMVTHDFHAITHFVDRVLLFQRTVISLHPEELCKHYTIGVYHEPHKEGP